MAHDESRATWSAFGMRTYPSHTLINSERLIVSQGVGRVTIDTVRAQIEASLGRRS